VACCIAESFAFRFETKFLGFFPPFLHIFYTFDRNF
jgi:hypothetical protein